MLPLSENPLILNENLFADNFLTIKFGEKKDPKLANIHIITGKNGSGKSTILMQIKRNHGNVVNTFKYGMKFSKTLDKQYERNVNNIARLEENRRLVFYDENSGTRSISDEKIIELKNTFQISEEIYSFVKTISHIDFKFWCVPNNGTNLPQWFPVINEKTLTFEQLSQGYAHIITFIVDLIFKVWELPEKMNAEFILLLDEVESPLHPEAQQRILPALQKMFPNAEIVCTTHSPFITNSVDNAWIYELDEENYVDGVLEPRLSNTGESYVTTAKRDFNVTTQFGNSTTELLAKFYELLESDKKDILEHKVVKDLIAKNSPEIDSIISYHINKYGKGK